MVPDCTMPEPNKETGRKSGDGHSTVSIPTLVPKHPRDIRGLSQTLVILQSEQDFIMSQGVPTLVVRPISRNPLHHKEFLQKLQTSSWRPGGLRQNQTTICCLQSGLAGVNQGT